MYTFQAFVQERLNILNQWIVFNPWRADDKLTTHFGVLS